MLCQMLQRGGKTPTSFDDVQELFSTCRNALDVPWETKLPNSVKVFQDHPLLLMNALK